MFATKKTLMERLEELEKIMNAFNDRVEELEKRMNAFDDRVEELVERKCKDHYDFIRRELGLGQKTLFLFGLRHYYYSFCC